MALPLARFALKTKSACQENVERKLPFLIIDVLELNAIPMILARVGDVTAGRVSPSLDRVWPATKTAIVLGESVCCSDVRANQVSWTITADAR